MEAAGPREETNMKIFNNSVKNEFPEWIFGKVADPEMENLMEKVEKALGIKLFIWQKTYIQGSGFRRYGATTAKAIRDLLQVDEAPLDFSIPGCLNARGKIYKEELREIKEKLDQAGIPTRTVFFSRKEKKDYYENRPYRC